MLKNEGKKMVRDIPVSEPISPQRGHLEIPPSKKPSAYVFDSNGDTRIILSKSMAQTLHWEADKVWIEEENGTKTYRKRRKREEKKGKTVELSQPTTPPAPEESPYTTSTPSGATTPNATSIDWGNVDLPGSVNTPYPHTEPSDGDEAGLGRTDLGTKPDSTSLQTHDWEYGETSVPHLKRSEFRMLVSGKHLELASPIFKTMLTGPFAEGKVDSSGFRLITASDWDPEAFKIIMTIIHGYNRDVPRALSLQMLVEVAMIMNYYDCLESIEPYTDIWLEGLRSQVPKVYGRDCIFCLFISWVFSEPTMFQNMTELALRHSQRLIEAEDFPIPADILEEIDIARQSALAEIFSGIYELLDRLKEEQECSFECSSMLLGVLTKELSRHEILHPPNAPPFNGFSIEGSKEMIEGLKKPSWYNIWDDRHYGHGCCIQDKLSISLAKVEIDLRVFDLQDFQATKNHTRG